METWCDWERREGGEVSPQPDHRTGLSGDPPFLTVTLSASQSESREKAAAVISI